MSEGWEVLARHNPLHAVSSAQRRWNEHDFLEKGREYVELTRPGWDGVSGSVLELGCGAGRMTGVLAEMFERVVALDVSSSMLAEAENRVTAPNVEFVLGDGERLPDGPFELVFSVQVLQHVPTRQLPALFKEMARVGKRSVLHVPSPTRSASLNDLKHLVVARRALTRLAQRVGLRLNYAKRPWIITEYNRYSPPTVMGLAEDAGLKLTKMFEFRPGEPRTTVYVLDRSV